MSTIDTSKITFICKDIVNIIVSYLTHNEMKVAFKINKSWNSAITEPVYRSTTRELVSHETIKLFKKDKIKERITDTILGNIIRYGMLNLMKFDKFKTNRNKVLIDAIRINNLNMAKIIFDNFYIDDFDVYICICCNCGSVEMLELLLSLIDRYRIFLIISYCLDSHVVKNIEMIDRLQKFIERR
jgi:hypothetical protein